MSENKENKYFHCHKCRHVWKTTDYLTAGDVCVSECPICEKTDDVKETTWRVANLALGWDKATGPVTEEGKERVIAFNMSGHGLMDLKGHRSVGGIRASIYNAMPVEGVTALRDFMVDFQQARRA